ncbi:MAG: YncE family protein [Erythrobacter sp.]|nr:MAG: YncE family protein [Erythrobacter sp.]
MRRSLILAASFLLSACATSEVPDQIADTSGTVFVANKRGASLSRIDLGTGEETHRAETCENPHELTVSPDERFVMVACYSGRSVEVFSTDSLAEAGTLFLGENARVHSALWLADNRVIAGAEGRGSLYSFEVQMQDGRVPPLFPWREIGGGEGAARGPHLLAVSPDARTAWGTFIEAGEVVRYDLERGEEAARRQIGEMIEAVAISPDGQSLWVSSNAASVAYRLDPMTLEVQAEVPTGQVPIRLAMHPSGRWVVSSNFGGGDLTVIDTAINTVARTIPVSGSRDTAQVTLVFSEDGSRLYAAETATDTIAEVDFASGAVLRRLPTGPGGDGLAVVD